MAGSLFDGCWTGDWERIRRLAEHLSEPSDIQGTVVEMALLDPASLLDLDLAVVVGLERVVG